MWCVERNWFHASEALIEGLKHLGYRIQRMHGFDPMRSQCDMQTLAFRIESFFNPDRGVDKNTGRAIQRYNMRAYKSIGCDAVTRIRWGTFMASENPYVLIDRELSASEEMDMLLVCNNSIEKKATLRA